MAVLRASFPSVRILLCQFHAIKWLRKEIASAKYRFTPWLKKMLKGLVEVLMYAKSELEYKKNCDFMHYFLKLTPSDGDCQTTNQADSGEGGVCPATSSERVAYNQFEAYFVKN